MFKASIGFLGSEIEIKELDLMLFIELNLKMQFVVKKAQLCLGASSSDLLLSRGQPLMGHDDQRARNKQQKSRCSGRVIRRSYSMIREDRKIMVELASNSNNRRKSQ